MALAPLGALAPVLAVVNGTPTTTSADVARHFGKRHDNVIQAIKVLREQVGPERLLNFQEASIEVAQPNGGKVSYPAYRLTRDGFTLLAMGFTGKKALAFKLAYIDAFNRMEAELAKPAPRLHGDTLQSALRMAATTGAQVQQAVFAQLVQGTAPEDLAFGRWLVCMDHTGAPKVREIARDAVVASYATIARNLGDPGAMPKTEHLVALANASLGVLAARKGHAAPKAVQALPEDVRPLFDAAVARLCADAHAYISDWAVGRLAYGCNLQHADRRAQRASETLDELRFDDWLSQGETAKARALLRLYDIYGQMVEEAKERLKRHALPAQGPETHPSNLHFGGRK